MRAVGHAEGRADVLQVVLHDGAAVLGDERVERVAGFQVGQVGPRAEDAQRAQLAAMLVRHDVVGIVGPRAGVAEAAENLARQHAAGGDPVGAVGVARGPLEHRVDVVARERRPLARRAPHGRLRIDRRARSGSNVVRNVSTWL